MIEGTQIFFGFPLAQVPACWLTLFLLFYCLLLYRASARFPVDYDIFVIEKVTTNGVHGMISHHRSFFSAITSMDDRDHDLPYKDYLTSA
jgi:hypothetical protein